MELYSKWHYIGLTLQIAATLIVWVFVIGSILARIERWLYNRRLDRDIEDIKKTGIKRKNP